MSDSGYSGEGGVSYGRNGGISDDTRHRAIRDAENRRLAAEQQERRDNERLAEERANERLRLERERESERLAEERSQSNHSGSVAGRMERDGGQAVADADARDRRRLRSDYDQVAHETAPLKPEAPRREVAHQEQTNIYGGPT